MAASPRTLDVMLGSVSLTAAEDAHPNKMRFKGVLVRLDEPSTKPPNGSDGHKILLPTSVAKARLSTLIGMGLNYDPSLKQHAPRRKVGIINKAWIEGKDLWVEGHIWKGDFQEAETDLKQKDLGMSMEIGDVHVEDVKADIWNITDCTFNGATILYKNAAAYAKTLAIAAQAQKEKEMADTKKVPAKKTVTAASVAQTAATAAAEAIASRFEPILTDISETLANTSNVLASIAASQQAMTARLEASDELEVEAAEEVDDMKTCKECGKEDCSCDVKASEDEEEYDEELEEDEMESASDMGPKTADPGDTEPGHLADGHDANHGTGVTDKKVGKTVSKGVTGSAREKVLEAQVEKLNAQVALLKKKMRSVGKQVSAAAEKVTRRSVPAEVTGLLGKASIDASALQASGRKLTVEEVDGVLAGCGIEMDSTRRMAFKNSLLAAGLMEDGQVERGLGFGAKR
jgi:hypothetical protein